MGNLLKDVEVWFTDRPQWVQDAARRLIINGEITETDLNELVNLCKSEVGLLETEVKFIGIPKGCLTSKEENINLKLIAIKDLKGINALCPRKPLQFGESPLTVIYGQNGSGKSGYVRLLKHACGAKEPGKLLGNVFNSSCLEQGCCFDIAMDSSTKEIEWIPKNGVLSELRSVELYDSDCANVYVNEENELSYEPWILSLFSKLTEVCDNVGQALKNEADQKNSQKPKLPDELNLTDVAAWYNKLSHKTKEQQINEKCLWTKELEDELSQIKQRLTEANPVEKAQFLRKTKSSVESLKSSLEKVRETLTTDNCKTYVEMKKDAILKRKV
jgi:energy-coupling factor transporter ATP-binding protein EcfA2